MSFLRADHSFLSQAFGHGTTKFVIYKNLSPLVSSPSQIYFATYGDIRSLVPSNPYLTLEEELVRKFDSKKAVPQLVFLGLDERDKNGLRFKNYTGAAHFALDVTPKPPYEDSARGIIAEMEKRGLSFVEGMRAMNFPADVGRLKIRFVKRSFFVPQPH